LSVSATFLTTHTHTQPPEVVAEEQEDGGYLDLNFGEEPDVMEGGDGDGAGDSYLLAQPEDTRLAAQSHPGALVNSDFDDGYLVYK
jgi:hypothetical protein